MITPDKFTNLTHIGDEAQCVVRGYVLRATVEDDDGNRAPWDDDGHGPTRPCDDRHGHRGKLAGERIISGEYGAVIYNFAEACKIARRDGWGFDGKSVKDWMQTGLSARQVAAMAAEDDFKNLKAFCKGDWGYCGVVVSVVAVETASGQVEEVPRKRRLGASLWGVECGHPGSPGYVVEVANELIEEAIAEYENQARGFAPRPSSAPEMTNWS